MELSSPASSFPLETYLDNIASICQGICQSLFGITCQNDYVF